MFQFGRRRFIAAAKLGLQLTIAVRLADDRVAFARYPTNERCRFGRALRQFSTPPELLCTSLPQRSYLRMSMVRTTIEPLEIEVADPNGDDSSTYVFDISDYLLGGEVCTGIALALSNVMDRPPEQMTPLSSVVDCDALQMLFHTRRYGDLRDDVSVTFPYDVYQVTMFSSGRIVVRS